MFKIKLLFLLIFSTQAMAQSVTVSDTVVDFGSVLCYQQQSLSLTLTNNQSQSVNVISAVFDETEFSTDLNPIQIAAHGQYPFKVIFESDQNINYLDFLRINLDSGDRPIIVQVSAQGQYENSYYDNTQNLSGPALKAALHNVIKGHTEYPYTSSSPDVWDMLKDTDEDPNDKNNVILFYTGWSYKKSDQNTGDNKGWNREHVWAKSHGDFGTSPPAGTDAHHLRPADVTVNSARGSLDFDTGGSLYTDDNGVTGCYYDADSWEPRDQEKGDVARMLYYMSTRYEGDDTPYDLELVDYIPSSSSGQPYFGKLSTLYQWHLDDPPNDWERRRNDRIYTNWQHNRNPFIDYPEFAGRIPSLSGVPITNAPEIAIAPLAVDMGILSFSSQASYALALINTGTQELTVSAVNSSNSDFVPDRTSLLLPSESYTYLNIHFNSGSNEGTFSTTLTIQSNDEDESTVEIPVTIEVQDSTSVLKEYPLEFNFMLAQNYPNPFNPATLISYELPERSLINLSVYNALGQKISTLINGVRAQGAHKILFNGKELPSGVYYYQLKYRSTGPLSKLNSISRKMLLVR